MTETLILNIEWMEYSEYWTLIELNTVEAEYWMNDERWMNGTQLMINAEWMEQNVYTNADWIESIEYGTSNGRNKEKCGEAESVAMQSNMHPPPPRKEK
jgi:hypothetical protein